MKFVPTTVSVKPLGLQYGVAGMEPGGAERDPTVGRGPGAALIVKGTKSDISVVLVALVPEAPETAEPGIWMATCTLPGVAKYDAGTVAVTWVVLIKVVLVKGVPFHKIYVPVETKPVPLAVSSRPVDGTLPAIAVVGLTYVSVEEDV